MKRLFTFIALLCLIGAGNVWAATVAQWTFNDGNWTTTKSQVTSSSYWTITTNDQGVETEARNTQNIPANNGIDKVNGLAFTAGTGGLCLDWTNNCIWLWGSVTVPNLEAGQVVTFVTAQTDAQITVNGTTLEGSGTYTYNVTADATDGLAFNVNGKHILSITVTNSEYSWEYTTTSQTLDGTSRKTTGTFAFTAAGTINSGTVIDEVPGITATVTKGSTDLTVTNVTQTGRYVGFVLMSSSYADHASTITFTPTVNGFLSLQGNFYGGTKINDGSSDIWSCSGNSYLTSLTEIATPLQAGKTYTLSGGSSFAWELHAFKFRPAFLNPTSGDDQTYTDFDATIGNPTKSGFPKLIDPTNTVQQENVKFSGDKTKVYLYNNNDVELLDAVTDILIRGTVLDKNGDDGLVAYYHLNSNILKMTPETDDQAYITAFNVSTEYAFTNANTDETKKPMELVSGATITVQKDGDDPNTVNPEFSESKWAMYIPITLEAGATYRITIPEGSVKETNTGALNAEIVHTFSVKDANELELKMIYPTGIATVGTTIVLETNETLNDSKKVTCVLSAEGEKDMEISAAFGDKQLVFKPTSTLKPNTTYTLTYTYDANNNVITSRTNNKVTHSKVFTFKTGSASGTEPKVVSTTPLEGYELNASSTYSGGTISFTFDQTIDLEPYSTVNATPVNGSEATAHGDVRALNYDKNTLKVDSDGKTLYFTYEEDGLKYDLYYEVVIPANTVVGAGGTPNSEPITLNFKMGQRSGTYDTTTDSDFYPHTWDFCKFGDGNEGSSSYMIASNAGELNKNPKYKNVKNALQYSKAETDKPNVTDADYEYRSHNSNGNGFDQGNNVYIATGTGTNDKYTLPEFKGIRISLTKSMNNRFSIRHMNGTKNGDETDKWNFLLWGNTHYLTLPNIPAGKIYMVVKASHLGINTPGVTFESVNPAADDDNSNSYTLSDDKTLLNTKSKWKKVVINVPETGDVSFCVMNFCCEKIGVTPTYKSFNDWDGKGYSTEWRNHTERYDLTNCFTDYDVTAEAVTAYSQTSDDGTGKLTLFPVKVAGAETPVIVTCTSTGATEVPLFATDVNTPTTTIEGTNYLVGNTGTTSMKAPIGSYIMTTQYYNTDSEGNIADGAKLNTGDLGFYKVVKDNFNTVGVNKAYLQLPASAPAKGFMFIYDEVDYTDGAPTKIEDANTLLDEDGAVLYNMQGQRVNNPQRGIYIKNGKKFYVK